MEILKDCSLNITLIFILYIYFNDVTIPITNNIIINITNVIQIGLNTQIQDHSITLHSFKTINAIVNNSKNSVFTEHLYLLIFYFDN